MDFSRWIFCSFCTTLSIQSIRLNQSMCRKFPDCVRSGIPIMTAAFPQNRFRLFPEECLFRFCNRQAPSITPIPADG